jgi:hypothetical protein
VYRLTKKLQSSRLNNLHKQAFGQADEGFIDAGGVGRTKTNFWGVRGTARRLVVVPALPWNSNTGA